MGNTTTIDTKLNIIMEAQNRSNATMKEVANQTNQNALGFKGMAGAMALGQAGFAALSNVAGKAIDYLKGSVDAVTGLAKQTITLQRQFGLTAEQGSGLIAVFDRFGIKGEAVTKSLGMLEKNMLATKDSTSKQKTALQELGINVVGTDGHLRNMNDVLLDTADKFKNDIPVTERAARAKQLFGKAGQDLIPVLIQGKDGIQDLMEHAAKLGVVLTQDNLDAVKKNAKAQKDWNEAMLGVKIRIGNDIMPLMAKFSTWLATDGITNLGNFTKEFYKIADAIIKFLKPSWDALVKTIQEHMPELKQLYEDVIKPLAQGLGVELVAGLWLGINALRIAIDVVSWLSDRLHSLKQFILNDLPQAFDTAFNFIKDKFNQFKEHAAEKVGAILMFFATLPIMLPFYIADAITKIVSLVLSLKWGDIFSGIWQAAQGAWDKVTQAVNKAWQFIHDLKWGDIFSGIGKDIGNAVLGMIQGAINAAFSRIPGKPHVTLPRFASGVKNFSGGLAIVGEEGPELVNLPAGSDVIPNGDIPGGSPTTGAGPAVGEMHFHVHMGMYAGMPSEKRAIAVDLYKEVVREARAHNVQLPQLGSVSMQ